MLQKKLNEERVAKIKRMMKDKDIDALVVTTIDSVRYLTDINYTISSSYAYEGWVAVISRDSDPKLLGPSAARRAR